MAVVAAGLHWGTFAAGGSDSYCYVHQAEGWAAGRLQVVEPLALEAPWPDPPLTFAPAGHIPSPAVRGAAAPICPAGLSIAMVPFVYAGAAFRRPDAMFAVVPLFGALLVWSVYLLGSRFSQRVGLASALLVACSPAFLFQLMQPMSDVPAAALWVLAAAVATSGRPRAPLLAGLVTSAAILMRPNLLPMGVVLGLSFLPRCAGAATFAAASAPGCIAVALIQQMFYGSPFRSGYGTLEGLFAFDHVVPNAIRYATWMWQSHTPIWLVALAAPFVLPRRLTGLLLSLAAVNVLCYLPYAVFNDWWYVRFLLPGIAIVLVLVTAVIDALAHLWREPSWLAQRTSHEGLSHRFVVAALTIALSAFFIRQAQARSVFDLQRLEARYGRAGAYVAEHLPPNALVITSWESGSVRFYGHRNTLVWDGLDPAWLDRAIAYTRTRGLEPYLLFERWEEPIFRQRFAGSDTGKLDWPPAAEIAGQVRIYRPDDRARYFRGEAAPTEYAR
ncbi:MAG TPA: hypothetical protein VGJ78_15200 [Vicinamibacterales bacterium]